MADDQRETVYTLTLRDQITATLQKILAQLQQLESQASKSVAAPALDKATESAQKTADNVGKVSEKAKEAASETNKLGDAADKAAQKTKRIPQGLVDFTQLAGKAVLVLKGVQLAIGVVENSWGLVRAAIKGSADDVADFRTKLAETVKIVPILGDITFSLGEKFNELGNATANLIGGQGFETDETKAARIIKETAALEKHTAKLKEEAEAQKQVVEQTKALTTSLRNEAAGLLLTQQDQAFRNIDETSKQIEELLKKEPNVDRFGTPTAAGHALKNFRDNYVSKLSQFYKTEYTNKAEAADAELQEARLEGSDRTNEADLVKLKQSLHERELEMAKSSAKEAQASERINAQVLANFNRQADEVRQRIGREFSVDLEQRNLAAQGTLEARQAADRAAFNLKQQLEVIDTLKRLRGAGVDEEGVNFAKDLLADTQSAERRALDRDQTFDAATHSIDRLTQHQGDLNFQIERTGRLYEDGKLTLSEVTEQQKSDISALGQEVQRVSAEIDGDLAKGILTEEQAEELKRRFASVREEIDKTKTAAQSLAAKFQDQVKHAVDDFLFDSIKGTKSVKDAFLDLVQNIADDMLRLVTGSIAKGFTSLLSGGTEGGGIFGAIVGTLPFAEGGFVPGVGDRDTVHAMLTPGEAVLPKRVVEGLGRDLIGRLIGFRQTSIPQLPLHFAAGGVVPQVASGSRAPAVALATVIAGNQEAERFFKGGHTAIVRYFSQHAALYRTVFGVTG